jgi:hypothetical protein
MRRRWIEAVFTAGLAVAGEHCAAQSAADASACIELLADDGATMGHGPHLRFLVSVGALVGDQARAAMLLQLMDGRAYTAMELARVAG